MILQHRRDSMGAIDLCHRDMEAGKEMGVAKLHYLNNIKALLAVAVVLVHASMAYGGAGGWYYIEASDDFISTSILTMINAVLQSFFMGIFFFISAYFSPKSYDNKGFYVFLKDRIPKLLIPALFYYFVLNPLCVNFVQRKAYFSSLGFYNLWFVMALLIFTLIYALGRGINRIRLPEMDFPNAWKVFAFIILLGCFNFITRLFFRTNEMYIFDFTFGYFPQYIVLFILGVAAYRNNWLNKLDEKLASTFLKISIVSIILLPVVFLIATPVSGDVSNFYGGATLESLFYSFWEPFVGIGIILKLLVAFKRRFNFTKPFLELASRCSYSIYIIQSLFIIALQKILSNIDMNVLIKVVIVTTLTYALCLAVSSILVRTPGIKKVV